MSTAVRPYLATGVAALSVASFSLTPGEAAAATDRTSVQSYRLTAASEPSLANVPANLLTLVLSIPAWEIQAMDRFADAMIATGSWQVWGPTNVFGFDEQDPPKLKAVIDMMVPVAPFSAALGDELSWWAKANLPMNTGCAARPGACPDLNALLNNMFKVPMSRLHEGYQFPVVTNPFTGEPTSWSGQYAKVEPWGAFTALGAYLTGPRQSVAAVTLAEASAVVSKTAKAIADAYDPFVPNSEWFNPEQTGLAPAFRAFAPNFCRSCDPDNLYDNPWLYENYRPESVPPASAAVVAASVGDTLAEAEPDSVPIPDASVAVDDTKFADEAAEPTTQRRPAGLETRRAPRAAGAWDSADRTPRQGSARAAARSVR